MKWRIFYKIFDEFERLVTRYNRLCLKIHKTYNEYRKKNINIGTSLVAILLYLIIQKSMAMEIKEKLKLVNLL